jgi:hypothetical protein
MGSLTKSISQSIIAAVGAEFLAILSLIGVIVFAVESEPLSYGQGERLAREIANWVIPIAGVVPCFLAGWWAGRKLETNEAQQGVSVGIMASIFDIAFLAWLGAPFRLAFVLAAIGRVGGGALGGHIASRRARKKAMQTSVAA